MKNKSMLLTLAALILVGAIVLLLPNNETVVETDRDLRDPVNEVPTQQANNNATSFSGVGRLLNDEEIVQLESELIEIRGRREGEQDESDDAAEHLHAPD